MGGVSRSRLRTPTSRLAGFTPAVSVLKPLCGVQPFL